MLNNGFEYYLSDLYRIGKNCITTLDNCVLTTVDKGIESTINLIKNMKVNDGKILFIGNGGSAGICSHMATDYTKNGRIRALAFSDAATLTCISNDYEFEQIFAKQIEFQAHKEDMLIAISSSGKSPNILKAVDVALSMNLPVITLSGFNKENPLSKLGNINFYIDSNKYGFVEISHLCLLHAILDIYMGWNPNQSVR